jgi:hypothetical protein
MSALSGYAVLDHLDAAPARNEAMEIVAGRRIGPFVVFVDGDCRRHAVRLASVLAISDADEQQEATVMQLPGGRAIQIYATLDEVLTWFGCREGS